MSLCKYKDMFGSPRTGAHHLRVPIIDIAAVDFVLTLAVAYMISFKYGTRFTTTFFTLILLGVIMHAIFCVETKLNIFLLGQV